MHVSVVVPTYPMTHTYPYPILVVTFCLLFALSSASRAVAFDAATVGAMTIW